MKLTIVDPFYAKDGPQISPPSFERNSIKSAITISASCSLENFISNDNDGLNKFSYNNTGTLWCIRPIKEEKHNLAYLASLYSESGLFCFIDWTNFTGFDWISLLGENELPPSLLYCDKVQSLYTDPHPPPLTDDGWLEHGSFSVWIEGTPDSVDNVILSSLNPINKHQNK